MSLLRVYRRYARPDFAQYRRFEIDGRQVGWVRPDLATHIVEIDADFRYADALTFSESIVAPEDRSAAMARLTARLAAEGRIYGWRNELYPVNRGYGEPPLLLMERAATPLFGILAYGVNVNGFTGQGWGMKIWVARRAADKAVDPGLLDLMVGGGLGAALSPFDCLLKECAEEAGIAPDLAATAKPVSITTLAIEAPEGLRLGLQFNYDLELPSDFSPRNADGEVAEFLSLPASDLLDRLRHSDDFMFDAALAKLDFAIRQGLIGPDDPDYLPLLAGLRPLLPFVS